MQPHCWNWISIIIGEGENSSLSDLGDKQTSRLPSSAINYGNSARVEELVREERRVTIDDIAERLGISHRSAAKIMRELGFAKI